ncbi:MAG: hypothetical protein JOZ46_06050 [Candidatus Dormibacteraeota bacterium]|nr:hypothetical protein [Candidatus Dormibacteraeota bacterium]MBV9525360.1 hypothetical protein [Candidatus Dormibacteraeota bacterium]
MPRSRPRDGSQRRRPHLDPVAARHLILPVDTEAGGGAARARFEAAVEPGLHAGAPPADVATLDALATAAVLRMGEVPYGSNAVFLLQLDAPDPQKEGEALRAVYKPARGERPLWDFPQRTLYLREVAAYLVDAALGLGHVPPTALRDGPVGPGSVQLFVHGARRQPSADEQHALEMQLRDVAMLDVVVNNADRKRSHLMVTQAMRIAAIDNALTFLPYPRQRTALISLGGSRLPRQTRERLRSLASDEDRLTALLDRLRRLLATHEVDAFEHRLRELAADPVYPVLDDWDGRPFEWW